MSDCMCKNLILYCNMFGNWKAPQEMQFHQILNDCVLNQYLISVFTCNYLNPHPSSPVQESLNKTLESLNLLKRAICTMTLPMINNTTPCPFSYAVLNFCYSNDTMLEVSLLTLNQVWNIDVFVFIRTTCRQWDSEPPLSLPHVTHSLFVLTLQILAKMVMSEPEEMMKWAGMMMTAFKELQNHSSLWDALLEVPRLLTSGSFKELLHSTGTLLTNVQG